MKNLILSLLLLVFSQVIFSQKVFHSIKEMNKYAFQNTKLRVITKGYFLDYIPQYTPKAKRAFFQQQNDREVDRNEIFKFCKNLEKTDISHQFNADSVFFPVINQLYTNYGRNKLYIPIFIFDIDFNYIDKEVFQEFKKRKGEEPFPSISKNQIKTKNVATAGLFLSELYNNNINIYWSDKTYFSNTKRKIDKVELIISNDTLLITPTNPFPLTRFYSEKKPLTKLKFKITFSDKSSIVRTMQLLLAKDNDFPKIIEYNPHSRQYEYFPWESLGGFFPVGSIYGDFPFVLLNPPVGPGIFDIDFQTVPYLNFSVLWGCDPTSQPGTSHPKILDKPFIIVGGWGPYTDNHLINQYLGWPSTIKDSYYSYNVGGYIDQLVGMGYDVIISRFYPPNASGIKNSQQLEVLINLVNQEKFSNGSYQENVIVGYSAGAMCVRLTLERMEYKHLQNASNPHHHCKLYISFDGEHGGANVPLGLQHAVEYLGQYANLPNLMNFITIYALHYILNAPLSKELLRYFYIQTGTGYNPKQGANPHRTYFMDRFDVYNHGKNTHNPGYPSFTRNISLSNGTSQRTAQSDVNDYYPYSTQDGKLIFKNEEYTDIGFIFPRKLYTQVNLLGRSDGLVFLNKYDPWWSGWQIRKEAYTDNPLILDNAAGGTTFLAAPDECKDPNITYQVLNALENQTQYWGFGSADVIKKKTMYTFTPLVFTHDIRNLNETLYQTAGGKRVYYDMKAQGLMYQSIVDVVNDNPNSFYGYPHLAHPNNHYSKYTPFDAVFAWDEENTMHIGFNHVEWNSEGEDLDCSHLLNKNHDRWEKRDPSPIVSGQVRRFIAGESGVYGVYIQNRHYGWNANSNYLYKADIVSKSFIYAGDSVTQRTDFKPVLIEDNAQVQFIACQGIILKPGFHAKSGSSFHAKIDSDLCQYCTSSGYPTTGGYQKPDYNKNIEEKSSDNQANESKTLKVKLYPNPSKGNVHLELLNKNVKTFSYRVYDLRGRLIINQRVKGNQTMLTLSKGFYLIHIKTQEQWTTKKLIIR